MDPVRPLGRFNLPADNVSLAAGNFYADVGLVTSYLAEVRRMAFALDGTVSALKSAIRTMTSLARDRPVHEVALDVEPNLQTVERHTPLILQLLLQRGVDDFLSYLSEILLASLQQRPELLRSPDTVRLDEVFAFTSMEEFIEDRTERRVMSLSQKGVRALYEDVADTFQIQLFDSTEDANATALLVDIRNLIAHRRGQIDRRFFRLHPDMGQPGDALKLQPEWLFDKLGFLSGRVQVLDRRFAERYGIDRPVAPDDIARALGT